MNLSISFFERPIIKVVICLIATWGIVSLLSKTSCQSDNGFRVEHSAGSDGWGTAKMGDKLLVNGAGDSFVIKNQPIDTTPKHTTYTQVKPKVVYHDYELKGSDTLFFLLLRQCNSPLDVTPRELNKIQTWLQTSIRQDTTTAK